MIFYDRSRTVTDWKCRRSRYYGYEYDGKGITSDTLHLELFTGTVIHDALSAIARNVSIDDIASAATQQLSDAILSHGECEPGIETFAAEQAALAHGLIRGFHRHVWPLLMTSYPKVVAIEQEMVFPHDSDGLYDPNGEFRFMSKPDLILADNDDNLYYIEYKSTSSMKQQWIDSWQDAVQLHSTCRAVEATLGRPVTAVIVQGLYKGYVSYNKQNSPFCYAYYRAGNPPFTKNEYRYDYAPGFKRYPTWLTEGGVKEWVENMPENMLAEQFPRTPEIYINDDLVNAFFRQRAEREREIALAAQGAINKPHIIPLLLDMSFQQSFDQCRPSFGKGCQFRKICHGRQDANPLDIGYKWREPHHTPEVDLWKARDA